MFDHRSADVGLLRVGPGPQRGGHDAAALGEQGRQIQFRLHPALQPDHHQTSAIGQGRDVALQVLRSDDIQDHVEGARLHEVLLPVVDQCLGAELRASLQLLGAARSHRDLSADGAGPLDGEGANARPASVDQQSFARLQARGHGQIRVDRAGHFRDPTGGHQVDARRQRHDLAAGHRDPFGVATPGQQRTHGLPVEVAGDLKAQDVAGPGRRRVETLPLEQVRPVDAGSGHVHQDLIRAGYWVGNVSQLQILRAAERRNRNRLHESRVKRR